MTALATKARTALALGLPNIARAASYRLGMKLGLHPARRLRAAVPAAPFFLVPTVTAPAGGGFVSDWQTHARLFSHWPVTVSAKPPDWLASPHSGQRFAAPERSWWEIPDFDPAVGDIKLIWEMSRMDWVLAFAQRARHGDLVALARLNDWLGDWCTRNPPYQGPNWKCGQEASFRVMQLAMAALMMGQIREPTPALRDLVQLHLQRVAPTLQYAMAQDNNHGTSEAAALFIGGSWLALLGVTEGEGWQRIGRQWLEERAARLIGPQGSFSQYSLNYHRVMLDTFCMAEVWRRHLALPAFCANWEGRALAATQWLYRMVNPINGDGPNVGTNDGARLLQLTDSAYRDHRPSVQLAMALFAGQRAYAEEGSWNDALKWLGVPIPEVQARQPGSYQADDGGFAVLRRDGAMAMLRYPRFRFRPGQADALHLDLWVGGDNLLRDAGTYSYNTEPQWSNYFSGTASHNTIQFDGRDQMPRISRFLFGDWLKTTIIDPLLEDAQAVRFAAAYKDSEGAAHHRRVQLSEANLQVTDSISGAFHKAVLRWRLAPGEWHLVASTASARLTSVDGLTSLNVQANVDIARCELVEGWESRHYLEKTSLPVLEIEIQEPGTLKTSVHWRV